VTQGGIFTDRDPRRGVSRRDLAAATALAAGLGILTAILTLALDDPPGARAARALAFWVLSLGPLVLAHPAWLQAARRAAERSATRWIFAAGVAAATLLDRVVRGGPVEVAGALAYAAAPLLITADRPRAFPLPRDALLVLALWLPLELGWVRGDFVLLRLLGLDLVLWLYAVERPLFEPGRIVPRQRAEWGWAVGLSAVFLALAVPVALATGFAAPGISARTAGGWALFLVSTFWVIALPEEALFRGTIQELLARALRSPIAALALASVVFGLSHLNNVGRDRAADWRYVLLATVAGVAYGTAYLKTRNLAAPALTHFLVDFTWRGLFAGR
jgi:hypothetical protein